MIETMSLVKTLVVALLTASVLMACSLVEPKWAYKANPVKADPALIKKVIDNGWLDTGWLSCNRSLKKKDYLDCILVEASMLPDFDPSRRDHFSWHYDPEKYYECRRSREARDSSCVKYKMRRRELDPVWPYPDVPAIQWPKAPEPSTYQWGMTSDSYFQALCEKEAGQFIYRTVENVEGVYQIRPRRRAWDYELMDPYVMEDVYHYSNGEATRPGFGFLTESGYRFFETSTYDPFIERSRASIEKLFSKTLLEKFKEGTKYFRYTGNSNIGMDDVRREQVQVLKSRYGYVWRGIKRSRDRYFRIVGGELAIVDLQTNEILALWRGFLRGSARPGGEVYWESAQPCPYKQGAYSSEIYDFVMKVLKPAKVL